MNWTVYCPRCNQVMQVIDAVPLTVYCEPCAYKIITTFWTGNATTSLQFSTGSVPCKREVFVPQAFYDAFEGEEVLEP